jgi:hypothetical protein
MVQRVALAEKHYGYRRVAIELRNAGFAVNRKRVLRLVLRRSFGSPIRPARPDFGHPRRG